jgi:hypothetical protein
MDMASRRSALTVTTDIIRMPARRTVTTVPTGLRADCLSEPGRGSTATVVDITGAAFMAAAATTGVADTMAVRVSRVVDLPGVALPDAAAWRLVVVQWRVGDSRVDLAEASHEVAAAASTEVGVLTAAATGKLYSARFAKE